MRSASDSRASASKYPRDQSQHAWAVWWAGEGADRLAAELRRCSRAIRGRQRAIPTRDQAMRGRVDPATELLRRGLEPRVGRFLRGDAIIVFRALRRYGEMPVASRSARSGLIFRTRRKSRAVKCALCRRSATAVRSSSSATMPTAVGTPGAAWRARITSAAVRSASAGSPPRRRRRCTAQGAPAAQMASRRAPSPARHLARRNVGTTSSTAARCTLPSGDQGGDRGAPGAPASSRSSHPPPA